jgi:hypothetical protein
MSLKRWRFKRHLALPLLYIVELELKPDMSFQTACTFCPNLCGT